MKASNAKNLAVQVFANFCMNFKAILGTKKKCTNF